MDFKIGDIVQFNGHRIGVIVDMRDNFIDKNKPKVYTIKFFDGYSSIQAFGHFMKRLS